MDDDQKGALATIQLAEHYLSMEQPEKGLEVLKRGSEQMLDSPHYWNVRAALLLGTEDFDGALATVRKGLAEFPDFAHLHALGAEAHKYKLELAQAETMILKALASYPEEVTYLVSYASLLQMAGQMDKAKKVVERAQQIDPEHSGLLQFAALQAFSDGENDKAVELLKEKLASDPEDVHGRKFLGNVYMSKGDVGAGSQQLSSAAYLSGGERDVSKQAREARVNAHWLLYPLRFIHRIGGAKIWVCLLYTSPSPRDS